MNYRYSKDESSKEFNRFQIDEKRTQNVVVVNRPYDQAKSLSQHLNKGGGFDGWTPHFFAARTPASVGV